MKFYDIPETVKRAVCAGGAHGRPVSDCARSGPVMRAAVEGRGDSNLKLLAVTVLTSFDQQDIRTTATPATISDLVELRVAQSDGSRGWTASWHRRSMPPRIRGIAGPDTVIVTPGVRSAGSAKGDQKRVATPAEAVRDGADIVVMGRQISRAADPAGEVARVLGRNRVSLSGAGLPTLPPAGVDRLGGIGGNLQIGAVMVKVPAVLVQSVLGHELDDLQRAFCASDIGQLKRRSRMDRSA